MARPSTSFPPAPERTRCGGIRFDPEQGEPFGKPFQVTDLGNPTQQGSVCIGLLQLLVTAARLMIPVTEVTGNIWMLATVDQ